MYAHKSAYDVVIKVTGSAIVQLDTTSHFLRTEINRGNTVFAAKSDSLVCTKSLVLALAEKHA